MLNKKKFNALAILFNLLFISTCHASNYTSFEHFILADAYINEKNGEYSPRKAFIHLLKGNLPNQQKHPKAVHELGLMFHYWPTWNNYSSNLSSQINYYLLGKKEAFYLDEAFQLYLEAANMGNPESFSSLGLMYMEGESVPPNIVKAFEMFSIGEALGDPISISYMNIINSTLFKYQIPNIYKFRDNYLKKKQVLKK